MVARLIRLGVPLMVEALSFRLFCHARRLPPEGRTETATEEGGVEFTWNCLAKPHQLRTWITITLSDELEFRDESWLEITGPVEAILSLLGDLCRLREAIRRADQRQLNERHRQDGLPTVSEEFWDAVEYQSELWEHVRQELRRRLLMDLEDIRDALVAYWDWEMVPALVADERRDDCVGARYDLTSEHGQIYLGETESEANGRRLADAMRLLEREGSDSEPFEDEWTIVGSCSF